MSAGMVEANGIQPCYLFCQPRRRNSGRSLAATILTKSRMEITPTIF